jgi:hypothetical protein
MFLFIAQIYFVSDKIITAAKVLCEFGPAKLQVRFITEHSILYLYEKPFQLFPVDHF